MILRATFYSSNPFPNRPVPCPVVPPTPLTSSMAPLYIDDYNLFSAETSPFRAGSVFRHLIGFSNNSRQPGPTTFGLVAL